MTQEAPYRLTVSQQPSYLHATATGARTARNAARFLKEAYEACVERNCSALLLEMGLDGPTLDMTSIVQVIDERSADGRRLRKIAYVDTANRDPDRMRFATSVAVERGVNVRVFGSVDQARRWMAEA